MSNIQSNTFKYALDPQRAHLETLMTLENHGTVLVDPTNPFTMLLEATAKTLGSGMLEMVMNNRRIYPSLSKTMDDILHNITDEEELHMIASPASTYMTMFLSVRDIINEGVEQPNEDNASKKYKIVIPANSQIIVDDTPFTIMDSIDVTLTVTMVDDKETYVTYVQYNGNIDSLVFRGVGTLKSMVIVDSERVHRLVFETPVKQVNVEIYQTRISENSDFDVEIEFEDEYFGSVISCEGKKIHKVYNARVIDTTKPTMLLHILEDTVRYIIPRPYLFNGLISGETTFTLYSTKGKILMPLEDFSPEDFDIKLDTFTTTEEESVTSNIDMYAYSKHIVDNGVNARSIEELRDKIIMKGKGEINLPVTFFQLKEHAKINGFNIREAYDVVTDRVYIADRDLVTPRTQFNLQSDTVLYNITTKLDTEIQDIPNVHIDADLINIRANTVYENKNGIVTPLTQERMTYLDNLPYNEKLKFVNSNKLMFTPYHYVSDTRSDIIDMDVYNTEDPSVDGVIINDRNDAIILAADIVSEEIRIVDSGYEFIFMVDGTDTFNHAAESVTVVVSIPIHNSSQWQHIVATPETVPHDSTLYPTYQGRQIFKTILKTDRQFIGKDVMRFKNTSSSTGVRDSDISLTYKVSCCVDRAVADVYVNNPTNINDIIGRNPHLEDNEFVVDKRVLTVQSLNVTLATRLDMLWRKASAVYKDRYFKKHNTSLFKTYDADVYAKDPVTGLRFTMVDEDGDGKKDALVRTEKIHTAGDTVLLDGQPVYLYKEGDVILGSDGMPKVDILNGMLRYMDMLMLDYKLIVVNKLEHVRYIRFVRKNVVEWCNTYLTDTNNVTLEHTKLYYRPNKSNRAVKMSNGSVFNSELRPNVKLYYNTHHNINELTPEQYTTIVGRVLQKEFGKIVINMELITELLKSELGNDLISVKLTNYPTEAQVIQLDANSDRFTIGTKITPLGDIVYDIDVEIVKI